ncbi:MAG: YraN family protein [Synergistales bacterium]|nr:YraN family protein [Bacteroidales bacterium]MDY6435596.1 YraN family protein [Synergistales bacterium]MDY6381310.1 YraN family protein [Bacteroidales bacterium]MDY6394402.1 YraN family protein [Bacteroidales bacterium]MDY6395469.1 YraN family protein [Bacteroidales bacterium]
MESTYEKGRQGEALACRFLEEKGYIILARNFVWQKHEIDIIAQDKNEVVFIEVKERETDVFGEPYEAVNLKKQRYIINVANYYLQKFHIDFEARFDIISIILSENTEPKIEHIIGAFTPSIY